MDLGIAGRVAMVAASSRGIGKAIALALAREGCRVSMCGRDREMLDRAVREIAASAERAEVLASTCDVTRPEQLEASHRETVHAWEAAASSPTRSCRDTS